MEEEKSIEEQNNLENINNIEELSKTKEFKWAFLEVLKTYFWKEDKTNINNYYKILDDRLKWLVINKDDILSFLELLNNKDFIKIWNSFINDEVKCISFWKMKELFPSGWCEEIATELKKISFWILSIDNNIEEIKNEYVFINDLFCQKLKMSINWEDKYCFKPSENFHNLKNTDFICDSLTKVEIKWAVWTNFDSIIVWVIWDKIGIIKDIYKVKESIFCDNIFLENLDTTDYRWETFYIKDNNFDWQKSIALLNDELYYIWEKDCLPFL